MPRTTPLVAYTRSLCQRRRLLEDASSIKLAPVRRSMSHYPRLHTSQVVATKVEGGDVPPPAKDPSTAHATEPTPPQEPKKEPGAMSRRLAEATEDALLDGGRAGQQAIQAAGFPEDLKTKLLDKIAGQQFKSENLAAFTEAELPSAAGRGTRDIAVARPWTGIEEQGDAVLRMLHDAHKPLHPASSRRRPGGGNANAASAVVVDMRLQGSLKPTTPGQRISRARERTSTYASANDSSMSMTPREREELRASLKERFGSGVHTGVLPTSFRGLESLANQRIEDAIARGQFRDIPRGTSVVRDRRADNPFIDTTEYIMNNMIKRQALVPPWIEKQQALGAAAAGFRDRLRREWMRHAVGLISARGGTVEEQVRRAEAYARAEEAEIRRRKGVEETSSSSSPSITTPPSTTPNSSSPPSTETEAAPPPTSPASPTEPLPPPLRDPAWEAAQLPYHTLAIAELNAAARAYNLQAPEVAKKPYFALERELAACFGEVAGLLAGVVGGVGGGGGEGVGGKGEMGEKGGRGRDKMGGGGGVGWRVTGERAVIREERGPRYGFRELWRDVWGG